jgi:purine-cytosine permease-like protein
MNFIKDGLSIDETRISVLVVSFLVTLGFALFQLCKVGDISDNLLTLLGYEIMAVTGVNLVQNFPIRKDNSYRDETTLP